MHRSVVVKMLCVVCVLVLVLSPREVRSSPVKYSSWKEFLEATGKKLTYSDNGNNMCTHGGQIRDLCEKCAKFTKNEVVYPLCCQGQEKVRPWCKEFLEYSPEDQRWS